jgi:hypothetical protein
MVIITSYIPIYNVCEVGCLEEWRHDPNQLSGLYIVHVNLLPPLVSHNIKMLSVTFCLLPATLFSKLDL